MGGNILFFEAVFPACPLAAHITAAHRCRFVGIAAFGHFGQNLQKQLGVPVGFELAGADKKYAPATAEIKGETVVLTAEGVKAPKYMRYGWAVFMNPNLVNEAGLPSAPCPEMEANKKTRR